MNSDQVVMIIRWLLSVGGPVGAYLVSRGYPADQITGLQTAIISLCGAVPPLVSFIWGYFSHTDSANIKKVEANPGVAQIIIKPTATNGTAAAAADPARPKVVTQ